MKHIKKRRIALVSRIVVLLIALGIVSSASAAPLACGPFVDIPTGAWYCTNVLRLLNLNVTTGTSATTYSPTNYVTRYQMAAFLDRMTESNTNDAEPYVFYLDHQYTGAANYPALIANSYSGNGVQASSYGGTNAVNGVRGQTNSTSPGYAGVFGYSTAAAAGVIGQNTSSGYGAYGVTSTGNGVVGYATSASGTNTGVWGYSSGATGRGVYGVASHNTGENIGVYGYTSSQDGFGVVGREAGSMPWTEDWWAPAGFFSGRNGLNAISNVNGYGVIAEHRATSGDGAGIYARTYSTTGWSGRFYTSTGNGVTITTPAGKTGLTVIGGTKNAQVATDDGDRLLYTEEATEVWFTDYGFGQLEDGTAIINIDPIYAQTVNLEEAYHVFVQVYGDAEVYVSNRTPTQFEVHLRDGDANVEFSYRIVAKRLGYEGDRLEPAPWADSDPDLSTVGGATHTSQEGGAAQQLELDTSPPVPLEQQPESGE
jgi:hypothetical protein